MASSLDHQAFGQTRAEWLANLNTEYKPPREFRRTSIICTIGMCKRELQRPNNGQYAYLSTHQAPRPTLPKR